MAADAESSANLEALALELFGVGAFVEARAVLEMLASGHNMSLPLQFLYAVCLMESNELERGRCMFARLEAQVDAASQDVRAACAGLRQALGQWAPGNCLDPQERRDMKKVAEKFFPRLKK